MASALLMLLVNFQAGAAAPDPGTSAASVRQVVADWADAWRAGLFNEYAAYYVADFRGDRGSHVEWRKQRRARIDGRQDIRIDLGLVLVQLHQDDPDLARAVFLQSYQSDSWCDVVEKTLTLRRTEQGWRINDERSIVRRRC